MNFIRLERENVESSKVNCEEAEGRFEGVAKRRGLTVP